MRHLRRVFLSFALILSGLVAPSVIVGPAQASSTVLIDASAPGNVANCASPINSKYGNVITAGDNSTITQIDYYVTASSAIVANSLKLEIATGNSPSAGGTLVATFAQTSSAANAADGATYYVVTFTGTLNATSGVDYFLQPSYVSTNRSYSLCLSSNAPTYQNNWQLKRSGSNYVNTWNTGTFNWFAYHKVKVTAGPSVSPGSLQFNGSNYISFPSTSEFNLTSSDDITIEWWQKFNPTNSKSFPRVWSIGGYATGRDRIQISLEAGRAYIGFGTNWVLSPSIANSDYHNVWSHWSLVRRSGTLSLYLNGTSIASVSNNAAVNLSSDPLVLGAELTSNVSQTGFAGFITQFRIVKSALRSASFTPELNPSVAANTLIHIRGNSDAFLADSSTFARTATNNGSVVYSTDYPTLNPVQAPTIGSASISGTTTRGQTLTASAGSLGGGAATSTTYQWQRATTVGGAYSNITGATNSTYVLSADDVSRFIRVQITVSNTAGSNSATSSATSQIAEIPAPTIASASISGTPTQGQTLTASAGTLGGGAVTTTSYQWQSSSTSGGTYANIAGATASTYILPSAQVGNYIKVVITVTNAGGSASATSSATNVIAPIAPTIGSATIAGTPSLNETLTATAGSLGGGPVTSTTYQWQASNTASGTYSNISGATNNTIVLSAAEVGKYVRVVITVSNAAGSASRTSSATATAVNSNIALPTISSITPSAGPIAGGSSVTISGTNLLSTTDVTFDGTAATISSKTSTQLVVVTPAHAAGAVDVVVTNTVGSVTSVGGYTYATTPTTRTWTATPNVNTSTVGGGGNTITVVYQATCPTPQRYGPSMYDIIYASSGGSWLYNSYMGSGTSNDGGYTWRIQKTYAVTTPGLWRVYGYTRGACFDGFNFTYTPVSYVAVDVSAPTISSLSVTSGPATGGTTTVVSGTNLSNVTGITVGGTPATVWRNNTGTSVTFITPAGSAGAQNVVITTPAGTASSNNAFTYIGPITVTYDVNGADSGTPSRTSDSYSPNTGGFSLPTVGSMTKAGHSFGGWATANNSNTALTSPYNPQTTLTVYAIWTVRNYTTTYNANGATSGSAPTSSSNAFGATVTVAGNTGSLTRTGFTLDGWNTQANGSGTNYILGNGTFTQGAANQILYANWVPDTYSITYNVNGSTDAVPADQTGINANATVNLAPGVTKAGFAFAGWQAGGINYKAGAAFTIGTSNVTMVAQWIAVYKLSYNLNGAGATAVNLPADFQYADGDPVTVTSVVPTRTGYEFGGWIDQSGTARASGANYNINGTNYLLYAVWNPISYTVTYMLNGASGNAPTETSKNINNTFTVAPAPSRTGYTFTGWKDGANIVYGAGNTYVVSDSNVTLTAQWSANSYSVSYDLAQGSSAVPATEIKVFASSWSLPSAPTRVGYNFADWFDGANGYAAGASYTLTTAGNLTLTARWNAIVYYKVTYDLNGGLGDAPVQDPLENGQSFTLPANPQKTGFSFTGWSYNNQVYSAGQSLPMPAQNITVTAQWTESAAGTYAVTYISNGAQTPAPTVPSLAQGSTFVVDNGAALIRSGYLFGGWSYSNTIYYGGETFTMPASAVTFSAIWVPALRATAVSQTIDSTSINRGQTVTVTYSVGCYNFSNTTPTLSENVVSTNESFTGDISSGLIVIDAGYNWTITRVYTLSEVGTYTVSANASGGCFSVATNSTSISVTVSEPPVNNQNNNNQNNPQNNGDNNQASATQSRITRIAPVTVVGARVAKVANEFYTLPKLDPTTVISVEARTGASSESTETSQNIGGSRVSITTMLSVNSAARGLSTVKIVENQLAVVPEQGFSGKTNVTVTVTDGTSTTQIEVPVTVLPEPVRDPAVTPQSSRTTLVTWEASPNANSYQVFVDGRALCSSDQTTCTVNRILGPNAEVQVVANGGDLTQSEDVSASYQAGDAVTLTRILGNSRKTALSESDKLKLDRLANIINTQGFQTVEISNITVNARNKAAAEARLEAIISYLSDKVESPDIKIEVVDPTGKTLTNSIAVK